jgi:hypothetical protein
MPKGCARYFSCVFFDQARQEIAEGAVDGEAFLGAAQDQLALRIGLRLARHLEQQQSMLHVGGDMLGVGILLLHRDAEIVAQLLADAARQAAALDQLFRIGDLEAGGGGEGFDPRTLLRHVRQARQAVKVPSICGALWKSSGVRPRLAPCLIASV